jgi:hypothetical protein
MTIGALLASLTAGTLGLAALSPHAAEAGDFPSLNFIKFCLGPIRPKLESYVGRVSSAKRKDETVIGQASWKIAPEKPRNHRDWCDVQGHWHQRMGNERSGDSNEDSGAMCRGSRANDDHTSKNETQERCLSIRSRGSI